MRFLEGLILTESQMGHMVLPIVSAGNAAEARVAVVFWQSGLCFTSVKADNKYYVNFLQPNTRVFADPRKMLKQR